jgi:hypothetical protein
MRPLEEKEGALAMQAKVRAVASSKIEARVAPRAG